MLSRIEIEIQTAINSTSAQTVKTVNVSGMTDALFSVISFWEGLQDCILDKRQKINFIFIFPFAF